MGKGNGDGMNHGTASGIMILLVVCIMCVVHCHEAMGRVVASYDPAVLEGEERVEHDRLCEYHGTYVTWSDNGKDWFFERDGKVCRWK